MAEVEQKKKCTFRKFTYRGVDLDQLLTYAQLMQLDSAPAAAAEPGPAQEAALALRRLRKAKEAPPMEKPEVLKTHLRDMIAARDDGHHIHCLNITSIPVSSSPRISSQGGLPGLSATVNV